MITLRLRYDYITFTLCLRYVYVMIMLFIKHNFNYAGRTVCFLNMYLFQIFSDYLKMLNQKIAMTNQENNECLKKIDNCDIQLITEDLENTNVIGKSENAVIEDIEKEYTRELTALSEKINYYKDVFQIDIEADKGL